MAQSLEPFVVLGLGSSVADSPTAVEHDHWMRLALQQAECAMDVGEVPVGAVVVHEGVVVGSGFNQPIRAVDPSAHAEVVALRQAARALDNYRMTGSTLYVTVEPCLMCTGAMVHARVATLVYGTVEPKAGAVRSAMRALDHPSLNHRVGVIGGVLEDECRALIQQFFRAKRDATRELVSHGPKPEA